MACHVSVIPDGNAAFEKEVLEHCHAHGSIEDKSEEMRKGSVRDTVRCPRAMMIHFWYASANH